MNKYEPHRREWMDGATPLQVAVALIVALTVGILFVALAQSMAHAEGDACLPKDLLQRCAAKALRGDYGKLKPWQEKGYLCAQQQHVTVQGMAWNTTFFPAEGFPRGQHTASGRGVSERTAAVCQRERHMLLRYYVWTAAYGMREVEDTGANSNHAAALRHGADRWLDTWMEKANNTNPVTPYAFIRKK